MKLFIEIIIKNKLKLPKYVTLHSIEHFKNGDFYIILEIDKDINKKLSTYRFKIEFNNNMLKTYCYKNVSYLKHDFNISNVLEMENEKHKNNKMILSEIFDDFSEFYDCTSNVVIGDNQENQNYNHYDIKLFKAYYFRMNNSSKFILKNLSNDVVEYYIRDYVFTQSRIKINDSDIQYFINAFYKTNCLCPFGDSYDIFSDEYKNLLNFEKENEIQNVIELLKINYLI